jgi:rubrerythrin
MAVDVDQLPIPDWDLRCPRCAYLLTGLDTRRCPECGRPFEMSEVVKPWTRVRDPRYTGRELPLPDFGLKCAACGGPLAGATDRACPFCRMQFDPDSFRPAASWFNIAEFLPPGLLLPTLCPLLEEEQIPHFLYEPKSARDIILGGRPNSFRVLAPREFFFDVLWVLREAQRRISAARSLQRRRWRCPTCGESNPGNFEICWNCGAAANR